VRRRNEDRRDCKTPRSAQEEVQVVEETLKAGARYRKEDRRECKMSKRLVLEEVRALGQTVKAGTKARDVDKRIEASARRQRQHRGRCDTSNSLGERPRDVKRDRREASR
jgi:hypothetical protein